MLVKADKSCENQLTGRSAALKRHNKRSVFKIFDLNTELLCRFADTSRRNSTCCSCSLTRCRRAYSTWSTSDTKQYFPRRRTCSPYTDNEPLYQPHSRLSRPPFQPLQKLCFLTHFNRIKTLNSQGRLSFSHGADDEAWIPTNNNTRITINFIVESIVALLNQLIFTILKRFTWMYGNWLRANCVDLCISRHFFGRLKLE